MNLCNRGVIAQLMEEAGICFRRDLGQNFLVVPEIPQKCAEGCETDPNTLILEIGPGIGCMTDALAARFRHVVAVEIDSRLLPVLDKTLADHSNVTVVNADIMKTDIPALLRRVKAENGLPDDLPVAVCANLPYYITTPILMYLLEGEATFSSITVMVQSEVADRLIALPGSADYGAISAVLRFWGEPKKLFSVPAGCFVPQPKVNSAVVRIALYRDKPCRPLDEKMLFSVIRAGFGQRRKTLLNALSSAFSQLSKQEVTAVIEETGLSPQVRAERLSVEQFAALADAFTRKLTPNGKQAATSIE